jgi:hypothetical protein
MIVIGIDPGPEKSAWCVFDGTKVVDSGIVLSHLIDQIIPRETLHKYLVAVEHVQCFGLAVGREVFETAYWIGYYRRVCEEARIRFARVYRSEIKLHFCQSMRAKDANIRQALVDRFGGKGTKASPGFFFGFKADMWSAAAIAIYAWDKENG